MRCVVLSLCACLAAVAPPATALQVFTDRAAWEAAVAGARLLAEDFEDAPLGSFASATAIFICAISAS